MLGQKEEPHKFVFQNLNNYWYSFNSLQQGKGSSFNTGVDVSKLMN